MQVSDKVLRLLVDAIAADDVRKCSRFVNDYAELAAASFQEGATREAAKNYFLADIGRYIYAGDTALHFAAAAYRPEIARMLIEAGAKVDAKNRHGAEPLHAAAAGQPGTSNWNPANQTRIIELLIDAGADPNAADKRGVAPLHIAARTRCAAAVETLLQLGADPARTNKNGTAAWTLANLTTGRGGSGSEAAKSEQQQILRLLATQMKSR